MRFFVALLELWQSWDGLCLKNPCKGPLNINQDEIHRCIIMKTTYSSAIFERIATEIYQTYIHSSRKHCRTEVNFIRPVSIATRFNSFFSKLLQFLYSIQSLENSSLAQKTFCEPKCVANYVTNFGCQNFSCYQFNGKNLANKIGLTFVKSKMFNETNTIFVLKKSLLETRYITCTHVCVCIL